jgi:hypothetical protein
MRTKASRGEDVRPKTTGILYPHEFSHGILSLNDGINHFCCAAFESTLSTESLHVRQAFRRVPLHFGGHAVLDRRAILPPTAQTARFPD